VKSVENSVIDEDYADDDDRIVRIDDRAIDIRADNVQLARASFTVLALPRGVELPLYKCGAPS